MDTQRAHDLRTEFPDMRGLSPRKHNGTILKKLKDRAGRPLNFLLSLAYLDGMDTVLLADLVDRLDSAQRLQTQFGFELWTVFGLLSLLY